MRAVRCIRCNIWIAPFGGRDLAAAVVAHLDEQHRHTEAPLPEPVGAA